MGADFILLDEREGRHMARRFGLRPLAVIGILLEAKRRGFIYCVQTHLDGLRETAGFWVNGPLYQAVLSEAGEGGT